MESTATKWWPNTKFLTSVWLLSSTDFKLLPIASVLKEQKNGLPIDLLPIDAVFMPIKRVSYNVEPARVGESLDFDKLTLEIWSNGSIEVGAALSKASNLASVAW